MPSLSLANAASGRDLQWFFDVYMYQKDLPELVVTPVGNTLTMHWKTEKNTPFPMPVEVRVGERIETLAMKDGSGSISVPAGATWTIDPHSKVLRRLEHIEAYQEYEKNKRKKPN